MSCFVLTTVQNPERFGSEDVIRKAVMKLLRAAPHLCSHCGLCRHHVLTRNEEERRTCGIKKTTSPIHGFCPLWVQQCFRSTIKTPWNIVHTQYDFKKSNSYCPIIYKWKVKVTNSWGTHKCVFKSTHKYKAICGHVKQFCKCTPQKLNKYQYFYIQNFTFNFTDVIMFILK